MPRTDNISPAIIESLYEEALDLAEDTRAAFDLSHPQHGPDRASDDMRVALSCEALRSTTRIMHAMAWLLNQRAFFNGEMTEFQLRRHGRLPPAQPAGDPAQLALFDPELRSLVARSTAFYARVARLDRAWRDHYAMQPSAVERLRGRLGAAYSAM